MKRLIPWFSALAIVLLFMPVLSGCGSKPKVTRVDSGKVTDLSGKWNDTDSRLVSQKMIKDMLDRPWLAEWFAGKPDNPVVMVGRIKNNTTEHINAGAFTADIERELINSGKISFVAGAADRDETRRERLDQLQNASDDTIKDFGKEIGADFMLFGTISTFVDEVGGEKAVSYQIDMYLVNVEKNLKVWAGQEKIKKLINRKKLKL
ncbi:penicillin-binding protein activator LpoB [bacterium]|nr:penicillin-binding protein activator LpoB [bacterium]